jgi:hypothetical protein
MNLYDTALKGKSYTEISDFAEKVTMERSSMFRILKDYKSPHWLQSINKTLRGKP